MGSGMQPAAEMPAIPPPVAEPAGALRPQPPPALPLKELQHAEEGRPQGEAANLLQGAKRWWCAMHVAVPSARAAQLHA